MTDTVQPIMTQSDYANAIEDQVKNKRRFAGLMAQPEGMLRHAKELRDRAAQMTAAADRIEAEIAEAPILYKRADEELKRLRKEQLEQKNQHAIKQVNKLSAELEALMAQLPEAARAALIAKMTGAE